MHKVIFHTINPNWLEFFHAARVITRLEPSNYTVEMASCGLQMDASMLNGALQIRSKYAIELAKTMMVGQDRGPGIFYNAAPQHSASGAVGPRPARARIPNSNQPGRDPGKSTSPPRQAAARRQAARTGTLSLISIYRAHVNMHLIRHIICLLEKHSYMFKPTVDRL